MDWKDMLEWAKGITGLVTMVILTILGGKAWRANRIDAARTDVMVAELKTEEQEANINNSNLSSMQTKLDEQGKKIDLLINRISKLESDISHLVSTNRTAIDLLEEMIIDEDTDPSNAILLRTVIKHLKNAHATHNHEPVHSGN